MIADILAEVKSPKSIQIDVAALPKGINNYHTDVFLSVQFCKDVRHLVKELVHQEASIKKEIREHEESFIMIRKSYLDMMTVLIHRIKTDLKTDEINFLQFSVPKYILLIIKQYLDKYINNERDKASELRTYGSGKVLTINEHITWLSKNFNQIYYEIAKQIFTQLRRVEIKNLKKIRKQYLSSGSTDFVDVIFNPMLMTRDINLPLFLIENHLYWKSRSNVNEFNDLNPELETVFNDILPDAGSVTIKIQEKRKSPRGEVYDDLGGLTIIKNFLGPIIDSSKTLKETLSWVDSPANIKNAFDSENSKKESINIRKEKGIRSWLHSLVQIKKSKSSIRRIKQLLKSRNILPQFIASFETRKQWNKVLRTKVEAHNVCKFLSGSISQESFIDTIFKGQKLTSEEMQGLVSSAKDVSIKVDANSEDNLVEILMALSNFRLQLKQYRFAHRIFNRINLLTNSNEINLSKQANTLYQLPLANEIEQGESKIVHHCILKADVRGSTKVMRELENGGLNPASYFSLRFFGPINKVLPAYGGNKVFVEGNTIILSFLEHEHSPQQWYSVAYACGLARSMLNIIKASNRYSKEMGLPLLELGIGISYSDDRPRFLYDGDQPIMMSNAISQASNEASCTYKLRSAFNSKLFNVEVAEIPRNEPDRGEQGNRFIRYNVNGILLRNEAFEKLKTEINLILVSLSIEDQNIDLYYGEFSDMEGKKKDLIIREGRIALWENNRIQENLSKSGYFYEVVNNSYLISLVREHVSTKN